VILDSRLTWSKHVDAKVKKAQNLLWACRRACGGVWGLEPRVVRWLYVSVIRPTVTFASLVWWPGCQSARVKKKLSSIQRLACLGITGAMRTTPTGAMEALLCLPLLELVVLSEASSAAHRLWSLGCLSYLHPKKGHSSVLTRLQQLVPIFSMGVDATRPTFNFEPRYRVTISHREDWTKGPAAPPEVKGLVWYIVVSKMMEGTGEGVYGQSIKRRLSYPLGRYTTVFQAEIYAILAGVYEIESLDRSRKHVSICSDSQAALKSLQATRTSLLVQLCQKALNDISTRHVVGLYRVPGHAVIRGNEITDELSRGGSVRGFLGPEPALGVSRREVQHSFNRWLVNQHRARWRSFGTLRQARDLIRAPKLN
jgi:ribonuclease HI